MTGGPLDPGAGAEDERVDARIVLDRMDDGFLALDADWRITYANDTGREIVRAAMPAADPDGSVEGRHLWEAVPAAVDTVFYEAYHEVMETGESAAFEAEYDPLGAWFDVRVFGSESGISVYFRDVTDRKRLERERAASLSTLQQLYAISSDRDRPFEEKLADVLELGREYLDLPNGFLTRIDGDRQTIDAAVAAHPGLQTGESCPLDEAYCKRTIELDQLLTVVDAADEGWTGDPAYDRFDLGTYVGGRVIVDGELFGTLCFADTAPRGREFSEAERTFVELLTRWVSYELERRAARERLERERDRLDEFASVVSHDLRNPLTTASGRVELLAEEVDSDHVPPLSRSIDRMDRMIDDLLSLAQDGLTIEESEPFALAPVAADAWRTVGPDGGRLATDIDGFRLRADEARVRQLLENLFRNSVEHGDDGVTVTVGTLVGDGRRGFFIADDGPGIPPDERDRIFESGFSTDEDGTGLGLSIVGRIADAHGWDVSVCESEDGGARFEFTGIEAA
ncbi:MAG: ATP-binding protein [Salinirussus sp.]